MSFNISVREAVGFLKDQVNIQPSHAVFLGSGLKDIAGDFTILAEFPLSEMPHFPVMTVDHMVSTLYLGEFRNIPVWILGGRMHYYEGYSMDQVVFPVRVLAEAGTNSFFFTNAAGNVNPTFSAGELVLIGDHINWSFPSPLIGPNNEDWGPRYPEMVDIYHPKTNQMLLNFAHRHDIQLHTGIYLGLTGPQLETPAEYRLIHSLGADMVGMSTIPEVIVAAHMKRRVTALSVLSNDAVEKPQKDSTNIDVILSHIQKRKKDIALLIQQWLLRIC